MNQVKETKATAAAELSRPALSVLFAADGSEQTMKAARFLAALLSEGQASVRLLAVLSMGLDPSYVGRLSDAESRRARVEEETEKAVGEVRRILEAAGQATSVCHRFGYPPDETLREVASWKPDLVVVGRRGLGRTEGLSLGSVSTSLVRHSKVPVMVVP